MINDPLIYKLSDNQWRVCIADSDVLLIAKGIAGGKNLKLNIFEANIDTLAVQGPKSFELMEEVLVIKSKISNFLNMIIFNFR